MFASSSCRCWRVMASTAAKGSSIRSIAGLLASTRATAARWRMPPESWCGYFFSNPVNPTRSTKRCVVARRSSAGTFFRRRPNSMFASVVFHGSSAYSWNTIPRSAPGPVTLRFETKISPAVGRSRPATMRRKVDLPQPDGPISETNSCAATLSDTPFSASTSCPSCRSKYVFDTPLAVRRSGIPEPPTGEAAGTWP